MTKPTCHREWSKTSIVWRPRHAIWWRQCVDQCQGVTLSERQERCGFCKRDFPVPSIKITALKFELSRKTILFFKCTWTGSCLFLLQHSPRRRVAQVISKWHFIYVCVRTWAHVCVLCMSSTESKWSLMIQSHISIFPSIASSAFLFSCHLSPSFLLSKIIRASSGKIIE